jgi:hypothetical protein
MLQGEGKQYTDVGSSDMNSVVQERPVSHSGHVGQSIQHLNQDDLEAYLEGRLPPARLTHCSAHLESCEACRAELEDLRAFKSDLTAFAHPEPAGRGLDRGRGRKLIQACAIASIVVAAISAGLWWEWHRPLPKETPVTVAVAHTTTAPVPAIAVQTRDTQLDDQIAALPASVRPVVSEAIRGGKLRLPSQVSEFHRRAVGAPQANAGFVLLAPFGEAIAEARPEFRWQPLAGAVRYSVAIVDTRLHPVQHSRALHATSWRPRRPLRRGQTYLWQVTATLRGGSTIVAASPDALVQVIPQQLADELEQFRRKHEDAHLVLGAFYAQVGMLTESANELKKVAPGDPSYSTARALLESLPSTSPDDTSRVVLQSH